MDKKGKTKGEKSSKLPQGGRIGRLAKKIAEATSLEVSERIMKTYGEFEKANKAGKAAWIKKTVERMERELGKRTTKKILESCGRMCCGSTSRKAAEKSMDEAGTVKEFIEGLNRRGLGGGRLRLKNKNTITGGYDVCYCGQVKHTSQPFKDTTYCHCSIGWYKQLFESALKRPVKVEIVQTIISGAKSCEFVIHI
jgi:predicted hydrocarbon binding protein